MTDQRDTLAREIDEELRREQLLKLWERYGTYLIVAVALMIAGIGGYKYYEYRRVVAAQAAGDRFEAAVKEMAEQKSSDAQKSLHDIAANGPNGYATLASLRLAAADRLAGKTAEARSAYESIAEQRSIDPLLAAYARLQAAVLTLDTGNWTDMQNRLNDLAADGNPWRFSARELLGLAAYKAGKTDEARKEFQRLLTDRDTPPSIGERAQVMLALLTESELAAAPATVPAAPAPSGTSSDGEKASGGTAAGTSKEPVPDKAAGKK